MAGFFPQMSPGIEVPHLQNQTYNDDYIDGIHDRKDDILGQHLNADNLQGRLPSTYSIGYY